jgi:hypothetical protein
LGSLVRNYRLYCLDSGGRFIKECDIHAVNDAEALQEARRMKLPVRCELWDRARMVAVLDPHDAPPTVITPRTFQ